MGLCVSSPLRTEFLKLHVLPVTRLLHSRLCPRSLVSVIHIQKVPSALTESSATHTEHVMSVLFMSLTPPGPVLSP